MYLWLDIRVGIIHKFVCKAIISHTHFRNINVLRLLHAISLSHTHSVSVSVSLTLCSFVAVSILHIVLFVYFSSLR